MGASLIPVPWVDLAAVGAVQLKLLARITQIYGVPFQESRGKALIGFLGGFIVPHAAAFGSVGSLLKAVPGVGALAGTPAAVAFSGAYTWALGNVFIQHFESGGTFLSFDPEQVKDHFRAQFEKERETAIAVETERRLEVPV